jgi:hypothetical protein
MNRRLQRQIASFFALDCGRQLRNLNRPAGGFSTGRGHSYPSQPGCLGRVPQPIKIFLLLHGWIPAIPPDIQVKSVKVVHLPPDAAARGFTGFFFHEMASNVR